MNHSDFKPDLVSNSSTDIFNCSAAWETDSRLFFTRSTRVVNIPSYIVKIGDEISIKESKRDLPKFKQLKGIKIVMPKWLEFDSNKLTGKINALPKRDDIDLNIQEHMIIELYSR